MGLLLYAIAVLFAAVQVQDLFDGGSASLRGAIVSVVAGAIGRRVLREPVGWGVASKITATVELKPTSDGGRVMPIRPGDAMSLRLAGAAGETKAKLAADASGPLKPGAPAQRVSLWLMEASRFKAGDSLELVEAGRVIGTGEVEWVAFKRPSTVTLLPSDTGGRLTPIHGRPQLLIRPDGSDAEFKLACELAGGEIKPGATVKCRLWMEDQPAAEALPAGQSFELWEADRCIGSGTILEGEEAKAEGDRVGAT